VAKVVLEETVLRVVDENFPPAMQLVVCQALFQRILIFLFLAKVRCHLSIGRYFVIRQKLHAAIVS
jgi:hypothetical protein